MGRETRRSGIPRTSSGLAGALGYSGRNRCPNFPARPGSWPRVPGVPAAHRQRMRTHRLDVLAAAAVLLVLTACSRSTSVVDDDAEASLATRQGGPAPSSAGEPTEPASPRAARLRDAALPTTGTDRWRMSRPAPDGTLEAFSTAVSGPPGEALELKVSTRAPSYRLEVYRLGAYAGGSGLLVHGPQRPRGRVQPPAVLRPRSTRTVVAPWTVDVRVDTAGWEPGFYVAKLMTPRGWETQVPYVVSSHVCGRHRRPRRTGHDLAGLQPVGRLQPLPGSGGRPAQPRRRASIALLLEHGPGQRLPHLDCAAGAARGAAGPAAVVLHEHRSAPAAGRARGGARGYVSMGHDEYWTTTMRDVVARARAAGTNLAILGANTMYWRVRLEATTGGRRVGWSATATPRRSTRCGSRTPPRRRPASATRRTRGPSTRCSACSTSAIPSTPTTSWRRPAGGASRGTGVERGRPRSPGWSGPRPTASTPTGSLPRPMQILSASPYDCRGVGTVAHSVYFTDPERGGGVQRRHAALGLCAGGSLRAAARRPYAGLRRPGDRQPPARFRRRSGRHGTARRATTSTRSALSAVNTVSAS